MNRGKKQCKKRQEEPRRRDTSSGMENMYRTVKLQFTSCIDRISE